jgi:hypothetical protein
LYIINRLLFVMGTKIVYCEVDAKAVYTGVARFWGHEAYKILGPLFKKWNIKLRLQN